MSRLATCSPLIVAGAPPPGDVDALLLGRLIVEVAVDLLPLEAEGRPPRARRGADGRGGGRRRSPPSARRDVHRPAEARAAIVHEGGVVAPDDDARDAGSSRRRRAAQTRRVRGAAAADAGPWARCSPSRRPTSGALPSRRWRRRPNIVDRAPALEVVDERDAPVAPTQRAQPLTMFFAHGGAAVRAAALISRSSTRWWARTMSGGVPPLRWCRGGGRLGRCLVASSPRGRRSRARLQHVDEAFADAGAVGVGARSCSLERRDEHSGRRRRW